MFLNNITPLDTHSMMKEYADFLVRHFVHPHLFNGANEVHVVFDNPGRHPRFPKSVERNRGVESSAVPTDHRHSSFSDTCALPPKWRSHISFFTTLILHWAPTLTLTRLSFLSLLLMPASALLGSGFPWGCTRYSPHWTKVGDCRMFPGNASDQVWESTSSGREPVPALNYNVEEADTRVGCMLSSHLEEGS